MIRDKARVAEIQKAWWGIENLRDELEEESRAAWEQGAHLSCILEGAAHSLPFVQACSLLNDVLLQLKEEGRFACKSHYLGALLSASKGRIPWKDMALIEEAVTRRNDWAHRKYILIRGECWRYIDSIGAELYSWGILSPDYPGIASTFLKYDDRLAQLRPFDPLQRDLYYAIRACQLDPSA